MSYDIKAPNTGDSLSAMAPDSVRKLWQAGVDVFEQSYDFFSDMEGGSNALIHTITDTSKGKGQTITFTSMSGFYDEPHMGEELFEGEEDFEEILIDDHDLTVDWIRHATRFSQRMEEVMGMRNEIKTGINEEIGKWLGRTKTELLFMMYLHKLNAENLVFANGKAMSTLKSSDVLNWDEVVAAGTQMKRLGGLAAYVGRTQNGKPLHKNCVVATTDALFSLELDPNYKQVLRETNDGPHSKLIFEGGYSSIRGHVIKEYTPIDHDGEGAIGSPLNAKAVLGGAISPGTGTFDVLGGGSAVAAAKTKKKYFKYFPGHAYRFLPADVLTPSAGPHYLLVVNPPNAPVDPNKWGFYEYTTGNNGNKITITRRLGSAAYGDRVTTLGGVTWDQGAFAGKCTETHPIGALIFPCTENGTVFGDTLMLGRRSARRGYGMYRNHRSQDSKEGGFLQERYITTVLGQAPRRDRLGRVPGVLRLRHALQIAGVPLPVVT